MKEKSIKKSLFIVGLEKFSMIFFQFLSSIILARLLYPEDYGIVAMLTIFIALATVVVDCGFGGSLVYFKDVTKNDYNTIFWTNLTISLLLYAFMYIWSNDISSFYNTPILSDLIKILGLTIVFQSLGLIQFTILYKNLEFKKIACASVISYILSTLTAIALAYLGFGVWALICHQVLSNVFRTCILIGVNRFVPSFYFSFSILKKHWNYGSGLLFSSLLRIVYDNMYIQLIGKYCSLTGAGYYNQAKKLKDIPTNFFSQIFDYSLFPIFSKYKDDTVFAGKFQKINQVFAFVCVPCFMLMVLLSKQIVLVLLGEKWLECSSILRWVSLGSIFYVFEIINRSALKAKGLSALLFKIDIIKRVSGLLIIFICIMKHSIEGAVFAYCVNSLFGWMINSYFLSRHSSYGLAAHLKDLFIPLVECLIPVMLVCFLNQIILVEYDNSFGIFIVCGIIFICVYIMIGLIVHDKGFIIILKSFRNVVTSYRQRVH